MSSLLAMLDGRKTYALGVVLLAYVLIESGYGREPDMAIVTSILGAMGITLRQGVAKIGTRDGVKW